MSCQMIGYRMKPEWHRFSAREEKQKVSVEGPRFDPQQTGRMTCLELSMMPRRTWPYCMGMNETSLPSCICVCVTRLPSCRIGYSPDTLTGQH